MAYTGKKPIDHTDVTQSQSMTVTDDLTVDTDTLYVDSTNNKVGVNTASIDSDCDGLQINSSSTNTVKINGTGSYNLYSYHDSGGAGWATGSDSGWTNMLYIRPADNEMRFYTNSSERMRIDSSGNVGINTTPTGKLDVNISTDARGYFTDNIGEVGSGNFALQVVNAAGSALKPLGFRAENIRFATGSSERMRIDSSGNVLVGGTALPTASSGAFVALRGGDNNCIETRRIGTGGRSHHIFYNANGVVGNIETSGSSTLYNTSSDYRLKQDMQPMTGAIERVNALNPVNFAWKVDGSRVDGFLAHEAQAVVPEAVTGTHDEVETWTQDEIDAGDAPANISAGDNKLDDDGNTIPVYQGIDQSKLVPLLTAALKEAITKIEALETENADFETRLTALEAAN